MLICVCQVEARLLKQTPSTLRAVIAPKIGAMQNIGEAALPAAVAQTLLFSSVSAIAGFSGHANYCAANAAVDALAGHDAARGLPCLAVQWGAWAAVGENNDITLLFTNGGFVNIRMCCFSCACMTGCMHAITCFITFSAEQYKCGCP